MLGRNTWGKIISITITISKLTVYTDRFYLMTNWSNSWKSNILYFMNESPQRGNRSDLGIKTHNVNVKRNQTYNYLLNSSSNWSLLYSVKKTTAIFYTEFQLTTPQKHIRHACSCLTNIPQLVSIAEFLFKDKGAIVNFLLLYL